MIKNNNAIEMNVTIFIYVDHLYTLMTQPTAVHCPRRQTTRAGGLQ